MTVPSPDRPAARAYATETVDCPGCEGDGEVEDTYSYDYGFRAGHMIRCSTCWGQGVIEVCAQCLDSGDECGECGA